MRVNMMVFLSALYDQILDHATQVAIHNAEHDYPRFLPAISLSSAGKVQANLALATFEVDDNEHFIEVYTKIFVTAYQLRQSALMAFPTGQHHHDMLKH
jgi:hypothetical protein